MSSSRQDLIHHSRREDNAILIKRQAAANALQQYSLLALQAVKDCEVGSLIQFQNVNYEFVLIDVIIESGKDETENDAVKFLSYYCMPCLNYFSAFRILTDLPNELPKETYGGMRKKSSTR